MVNIACSSLIQTILSVLEFHQISRRSGSRTITAGRESQLMLITTTPKNFLLFASDYTTYRYLLSIQLFHYAPLLTLLFQAIIINPENESLLIKSQVFFLKKISKIRFDILCITFKPPEMPALKVVI